MRMNTISNLRLLSTQHSGLEFYYDRCMVGRSFPGARRSVNGGAGRALGQPCGRPDVIDAQAEIALERAGAIVPPRELFRLVVVQAKGIYKAPVFDRCKRRALRLAEQHAVFPELRIMHVAVFGGNVEIAAQQHLLARLVLRVEELAQ